MLFGAVGVVSRGWLRQQENGSAGSIETQRTLSPRYGNRYRVYVRIDHFQPIISGRPVLPSGRRQRNGMDLEVMTGMIHKWTTSQRSKVPYRGGQGMGEHEQFKDVGD
jgi:hypothetical protein